MKIAKIETIPLRIPFSSGGERFGFGAKAWRTLDTLLIRIETDEGLVGWGDAFAYSCLESVQAAVEHMIAPLLAERDVSDIACVMYDLQKAMHLFGRYGITMFALSGIDIALWDLAAKAARLPLHRLLGGSAKTLPGYASLFRYADPDVVADRCRAALAEGYSYIKLHEIAEPEVRIARDTCGDGIPIMVDTNCPWTPEQARTMALRFKPYAIHWLEEPIFPPEDFQALAQLQRETGIALAAGENACTAFQFREMFAVGAVKYAQPSVTKVGGISEFRKILSLAEASAVTVMPHAPYFGPGFLATLQLLSSTANPGLVERIYIDPEASLYDESYLKPDSDGSFSVPAGVGLGLEPDADVIKSYRV